MKIIVMAGGSGTRLWPLSRSNFPKQFLKLNDMDKSIFQLTMARCLKIAPIGDIYIVTNMNYKFLIMGQIEEMGCTAIEENIILEPIAKNTLPAIYNGVREIRKRGEDVVAVFASDHLIGDPDRFAEFVVKNVPMTDDYLLTFGVVPTGPETGYGYIKPGRKVQTGYIVEEFKEKPDLQTAEKYVAAGYYWNSGMFMFRTELFTEEVELCMPEVAEAFASGDADECFEKTPSISIDYGIMEKSKRVAVAPLNIEWSDLGGFSTFYDAYDAKKDENGNVIFNHEILIDAKDNMIYSDSDKAIAVVGVDDLVVVDQKDAMLICKKDQTQKVKEVVNELKARKDHRADFHMTEYRPWGSFTILEEGQFYKIKRLSVLCGRRLSYQMHYHRSEHWIVVSGTATVVVNDEESIVPSGESIFVPAGKKHRLANYGKLPLEVIEVQSGIYLGEDDIVRFEDDYKRC
jgi:mannose-1-phosphate guanylyltransferase/mannose-6-phosphate isomerase